MEESTCPYVGLVPFTAAEQRFFFGRERETRLVINNLFAAKLTLLYGPSGVGKSSVLGAGVLAELARRAAEEETATRAAVYLRHWQGEPITSFRQATLEAVHMARPDIDVPTSAPGEELVDWVARLTKELNLELLVLFDQFEEYFVYHEESGRTVRDPFALQLAAMVGRPELPISFLLGLRDDALARLDRFKALIPDLFENYLRLDPLSEAAAREAIEKPLERWNEGLAARDQVRLGRGLVEYVVAQVRDDEDDGMGRGRVAGNRPGVQTPLLQLVLTRLWKAELNAEPDPSRELRVATLERELGGAVGIVEAHLDMVMADLSTAERELCGPMFEHLVTPSGAKIAHSAADLAGFAKTTEEEVKPLLAKLAGSDKRLLATVAPLVAQGEELYEIYHDALGRAVLTWQRRWARARERAKTRRLTAAMLAFAIIAAAAVAASLLAFRASREARQLNSQLQLATDQKEERDQEIERLEAKQRRLEAEGNTEGAEQVKRELDIAQSERFRAEERLTALRATTGQTVSDLRDENESLKELVGKVRTGLNGSSSDDLVEIATARMNEIEIQRDRAERAEKRLETIDFEKKATYRPNPGEVDLEKGLDLRLRFIPAGRFTMGSPESEAGRFGDETQREVHLTHDFWLAETEVTQDQWRRLMQNDPSKAQECGDACPIEWVTWWDAVTFANRLSRVAGLENCYALTDCRGTPGTSAHSCASAELPHGLDCDGYRLPTEAEWEYAARANTTAAIYTTSQELLDIAWYRGNSKNSPHPVTGKAPNAWGLHDMLGNVWEWTWDSWSANDRSNRVIRGGSWKDFASSVRCAEREKHGMLDRADYLGFRLARTHGASTD